MSKLLYNLKFCSTRKTNFWLLLLFGFFFSDCTEISNSESQIVKYKKSTFDSDIEKLLERRQINQKIAIRLKDFHFQEEEVFNDLEFYNKIIDELNLRYPNVGTMYEAIHEREDCKLIIKKAIENESIYFNVNYINKRSSSADSLIIDLKLFTFQNELCLIRVEKIKIDKDNFNFKLEIKDLNPIHPLYYKEARKEFQLNEIGIEKLLDCSKFILRNLTVEYKDGKIFTN